MRKTGGILKPFLGAPIKEPTSIGGARPGVQQASEQFSAGGMLASRVYAAPALPSYDQSDPRYDGKSDNVENIYLVANDPPKQRSGITQMLNWLFKGELR